jgi:membrane protein YdbS with pleckstrin-like domain
MHGNAQDFTGPARGAKPTVSIVRYFDGRFWETRLISAQSGLILYTEKKTMALINCPECGKQISTSAAACPNCGFPLAEKQAATGAAPPGSDELLMDVRPSWWGYFWHLFFFFLIVPPIIAWWKRGATVLRVYPGRIVLERGRLSKCIREFMIQDIRSVDIDQSFMDRMVGIGDLTIATAAAADSSEKIESIPAPQRVRDLILAERQARAGRA